MNLRFPHRKHVAVPKVGLPAAPRPKSSSEVKPATKAAPAKQAQPKCLTAEGSEKLGALCGVAAERELPGQQGSSAARCGFFRSFVAQHDTKELLKKGALVTGAALAATGTAATVIAPAGSAIYQHFVGEDEFDIGNRTLVDKLDSDQLEEMTQGQRNARELLRTAAGDCDKTDQAESAPSDARAQKRELANALVDLARGAGADVQAQGEVSVRIDGGKAYVSEEIRLTPQMTARLAAHFDSLGLSLDEQGIEDFVRHRGLQTGGERGELTPELARAYTRALSGHEVLRDLPADLTQPQQGALNLLESLDAGGRAALRARVGVPAPSEGPLARQQAMLGNEVIETALVDGVAAHYQSVGIPLTNEGIDAFLSQRGLPGPTDEMTLEIAQQLVRGLEGHETVWAIQGDLSPQQQGARRLLEALGPAGRAELRAYARMAQTNDGALGLQAQKLGNEVIDHATLDQTVAKFAERGIDLGAQGDIDGAKAQDLFRAVKSVGNRPAGEAERADWYRRIVQGQGYQWREGVNEVNVVSLRGYDIDGGRHGNAFNQYNDTIALVWRGGDGAWHVRDFRGTSDPGLLRGGGAPDVNGDGVGDIAHARPGQYAYRLGSHKGGYGAGNPVTNVPVSRDTSHDGNISQAEFDESVRRGDVGTGINLHWSSGRGGEVGPWSAGCQVIDLSQGDFRQQVTPLLEMNQGQMLLSIVDMRGVA